MPCNILPLHLKQNVLPIIWIFTEGEDDWIQTAFSNLFYFTSIVVKSSPAVAFTSILKYETHYNFPSFFLYFTFQNSSTKLAASPAFEFRRQQRHRRCTLGYSDKKVHKPLSKSYGRIGVQTCNLVLHVSYDFEYFFHCIQLLGVWGTPRDPYWWIKPI